MTDETWLQKRRAEREETGCDMCGDWDHGHGIAVCGDCLQQDLRDELAVARAVLATAERERDKAREGQRIATELAAEGRMERDEARELSCMLFRDIVERVKLYRQRYPWLPELEAPPR